MATISFKLGDYNGNVFFRIHKDGKHVYNAQTLSDVSKSEFSGEEYNQIETLFLFVSYMDFLSKVRYMDTITLFTWGMRIKWEKGDRPIIDIPFNIGFGLIEQYGSIIGFDIQGELKTIETKENTWGQKQPRFRAAIGGKTTIMLNNMKTNNLEKGKYIKVYTTNGQGNWITILNK